MAAVIATVRARRQETEDVLDRSESMFYPSAVGTDPARGDRVPVSLKKRRLRSVVRIQKFYRKYVHLHHWKDTSHVINSYRKQFQKYDVHMHQAKGLRTMCTFFVGVLLFYSILFLQKRTYEGYDAHDIIRNSLINNEWSHTNDWYTVDNIGANVGETVTDNVWSFIRALFLMWHRPGDNRRMPITYQQYVLQHTYKSRIRKYNMTGTAAEVAKNYHHVMKDTHSWHYPFGSVMYLKANFTDEHYASLVSQGLLEANYYRQDLTTYAGTAGYCTCADGLKYIVSAPETTLAQNCLGPEARANGCNTPALLCGDLASSCVGGAVDPETCMELTGIPAEFTQHRVTCAPNPYLKESDPESCKAMSVDEQRGMASYRDGYDYLPNVPVYGHADHAAGYVYNNNLILGVMYVKQKRYASKDCNLQRAGQDYYRQECLDDTKEYTGRFEPFHGSNPVRNFSCPSEATEEAMVAEKKEGMVAYRIERKARVATSLSSKTSASITAEAPTDSYLHRRRRLLNEPPASSQASASAPAGAAAPASGSTSSSTPPSGGTTTATPAASGGGTAPAPASGGTTAAPSSGGTAPAPAATTTGGTTTTASSSGGSAPTSGVPGGGPGSSGQEQGGPGAEQGGEQGGGAATSTVATETPIVIEPSITEKTKMVALGTCSGTITATGASCPKLYTDVVACPAGCTSTLFKNAWEIMEVPKPLLSEKQSDPFLPETHAKAGYEFSHLLMERRTKGNGVDPFCFDYHRKSYYLFLDLGYFAFPKQSQLCRIDRLKQEMWLDHQTKEVTIGVLLYNANLDLYTKVEIRFDFTLGGRLFKWVDVSSHQIRNMYDTPGDYGRLILEILFLLLLGKQWYDTFRDMTEQGSRRFFLKNSNLVNFIGQGVYFFNIVTWIILCVKMTGFILPEMEDYGEAYSSIGFVQDEFEEIHQIFDLYKVFNTISIILNIMRLYMNMEFHERLGLVTKTFYRVWDDLYHFGFLFFVTMLMFAFMGWNVRVQVAPARGKLLECLGRLSCAFSLTCCDLFVFHTHCPPPHFSLSLSLSLFLSAAAGQE